MNSDYEYITERGKLNRILTEALRSNPLFLDSEWFSTRVSSSTYHESLRLIQLSTTDDKCWLIDMKEMLGGPGSVGARAHVVWFLRQLLGSRNVKLLFSADSDVRTWLRTFPELVDHQLVNVCCMKKLLESMIATNPSLSASVFEGRPVPAQWSVKKATAFFLNEQIDKGDVQRYGWDKPILSKRQKDYAAGDVLTLKKIYDVIAARIAPAHLNELLAQCREAFQPYDLNRNKHDREREKNEIGQQQPVDAPLDAVRGCKKRGRKHPKNR